MSRAANFTIKGFLYQFNKSLIEILRSVGDGAISLEGVEDIDVHTNSGMTAIQCKYHEEAERFRPSSIYEPVLQMMEHFCANSQAQVRYILFCHYPNMKDAPERATLRQYIQESIQSKNVDLQHLIAGLRGRVDVERFLGRFSMEAGAKLDILVEQACALLEANGIPKGEIETLAYPNAIQMVATISAKQDPSERRITKLEFIESLTRIRKTAISRWTMALTTRKKILEAKRKQLKTHLSKNSRLRCFLIDIEQLDQHAEGFVPFVKDYLDKYHFKPTHTDTPIFCLSATKQTFNDLQIRLFQKGIIVADGFIGEHFDKSLFFREPLREKKNGEVKREFAMRMLRWEDHAALLDEQKLDDLFIVGDLEIGSLETSDVEVERISTTSLKELNYLIGVSDVYE
ncbi:MAG: hypothetical protein ABSD59_02355 [Terracidiphilus sp.]|jgi:hypothetical protein